MTARPFPLPAAGDRVLVGEDRARRPVHHGCVRERAFDIDVHDIDAGPANDEPAHRHYDFRFVSVTSGLDGRIEPVNASALIHDDHGRYLA